MTRKRIVLSGEKTLDSIFNKHGEPHLPQHTSIDVEVAKLIPRKDQPRKLFKTAELQELANSIKEHGVLQPLLVRRVGEWYEIIAGERRWRAAQLAGLEKVAVVIKDSDEKTAALYALIENIQRENLNSIEEATAYNKLLNDFSLTHEQVAQQVGKSRAAVTNTLRLLKLTPSVQDFVVQGKIEMGHARAILALSPDQQESFAQKVISDGLSVSKTEELIRKRKVAANLSETQSSKLPSKVNSAILKLKQQFTEKLNLPIDITLGKQNQLKIVITCESQTEAQFLLNRL